MYSVEIEKVLKKEKIKIGDRIKITGKVSRQGILMPKPDIGKKDVLILKLDNGYNIGIVFDQKTKLQLLEKIRTRNIQKKVKKLKNRYISLIATGGTIASKVDYKTGAAAQLMDGEEIIASVPGLKEICDIRVLCPFTKMTENMTYTDWIRIGKECVKELNSNSSGVIITQGTDFLHFTSAALSFMLKNLNKPVVFTAAQRSSDRGSSDARINLLCSSHIALSDVAEVGICMHGNLNDDQCLFIRGTKVRKMHSSRRDAFRPINDFPLAKVYQDGKIEKANNYNARNSGKVRLMDKFEEKVALIKAYPGAPPEIIDYLVEKKFKGIIIEAGALGHVPVEGKNSWLPSLDSALEKGVFIGTTSQCLYGRVHPYVYSNLRSLYVKRDIVPLEDMLPETAYVKLMWTLGHHKKLKDVKKVMTTNISGEITNRSLNNFLY